MAVRAKSKALAQTKAGRGAPGARLDFGALVSSICEVHESCAREAGRAVDIALSLRNWLIGGYICEYEQNGSDRAAYGAGLMDALAAKLAVTKAGGLAARTLRLCRQFYLSYPGIWQSLPAKSGVQPALGPMWQSLIAKFPGGDAARPDEPAAAPAAMPRDQLVYRLSFTHFAELMAIDDPAKRAFYELECVRGAWSVRELKRQIDALYFERSGLSKDKKKLALKTQAAAEHAEPALAIRDPYVFEFLGLKAREVMGESGLEDALLDRLQTFLLELGHGFCFEARQKRILIGDTWGFVDLVFYHRVLKCHVLIELKVAGFSHEHIGQLNTYVSWFKANAMTEGDNPPIGILLCTRKDHALVEYALAGLSNRLFVSKYQLELPTREQLQAFLDAQVGEIKHG